MPSDRAGLRELARLAKQLEAAEARVGLLRDLLDGKLHELHSAGLPVADLAHAAGVSRETVYKAIRRHADH